MRPAVVQVMDQIGQGSVLGNRHIQSAHQQLLMTGSVMGFTAGLGGQRTSFASYIMTGLIVILVFIVIDLDRPRRGLIEINQHNLTALQEKFHQTEESAQR